MPRQQVKKIAERRKVARLNRSESQKQQKRTSMDQTDQSMELDIKSAGMSLDTGFLEALNA